MSNIRAATGSDLEVLLAGHPEPISDHHRRWLKDNIQSGNCYLLSKEGETAGYISLPG